MTAAVKLDDYDPLDLRAKPLRLDESRSSHRANLGTAADNARPGKFPAQVSRAADARMRLRMSEIAGGMIFEQTLDELDRDAVFEDRARTLVACWLDVYASKVTALCDGEAALTIGKLLLLDDELLIRFFAILSEHRGRAFIVALAARLGGGDR